MAKTEKPKAKTKKLPKKKPPKQTKPKTSSRSRDYSFKDSKGKLRYLTELQYKFCIYYLENYGGNRADAIVEAGYDVYRRDSKGRKTESINYHLARTIAAENLRKPDICEFILTKLEHYGWNDENIELQHLALINQWDNLPTKQRAIADWNKLKGKYPAEKHEVTGQIEVIELTNYGSKPNTK